MMKKSENIKLALFIPSCRGGGAERVMITLANHLEKELGSVTLLLSLAEGPYLKEINDNVSVIDFNNKKVSRSFFKLCRYLIIEKPDVIFTTLNHVNLITLLAKLVTFSKTKVIIREANSLNLDDDKNKNKKLIFLMRLLYPFASEIVSISKGLKEELVQGLSLPESRITVIYNPVVSSDLYKLASENINHSWLNDKAVPLILAVGRLTKQKNFPLLIASFNKARNKKKIRLLILGEGEDEGMLRQLVNLSPYKEDIELGGFKDNPFPYMLQCDVFVLSSDWEGLGNVLIQALSLGKSIITTNCKSGPAEIIDGGRWGEIVGVGDVNSMSKSMLEVIEPSYSIDIVEQKRYARKVFGVDVVTKEYLNLIIK